MKKTKSKIGVKNMITFIKKVQVPNGNGVTESIESIFNRVVNNTKSIPFKYARRIMWYYLQKDEGLLESYKANVAMRISDLLSTKSHKVSVTDRNNFAEELIELIFS